MGTVFGIVARQADMSSPTSGFCYVADAPRYIDEARGSIASLRKAMPETRICFVAPKDFWSSDLAVDHWVELPEGFPRGEGPVVKTAAYLAPYARVVFVDTDTYVVGDLSDLFHILDSFDLALAHEPTRGWDYITPAPHAFCELNTGVIAFRNTARVKSFFDAWQKKFLVMKSEQDLTNDQPSFRTALWEDGTLRLATLPSEFHLICGKAAAVAWGARLLHDRGDLADMAAMINEVSGPRAFVPGWGVLRGYQGRRFWISEYLKLTRSFCRVLLWPTTLQAKKRPVEWEKRK
jgi:hypothetical protein